MEFNSGFKWLNLKKSYIFLNKICVLKEFLNAAGSREALMCQPDWSGSTEGLVPESCENCTKQFDFVKDIEILG